MKTYHLNQLADFIQHPNALDMRFMITKMLDMKFPVEACVALSSCTEDMRKRDVVGMFHSIGGHFGSELDAYIEEMTKDTDYTQDTSPMYSLSQLCFITVVGMSSRNMKDKLDEMGFSGKITLEMSKACKEADGNPVLLWMQVRDRHADALVAYFNERFKKYYVEGWPHVKAKQSMKNT